MPKEILFGDAARNALKRGIDTVCDAVKITMGPKGRNVVLDRGHGTPTITNDGVSIAKEIVLKDRFENMGAEAIKEVATKTNDSAGDGTTTSVVLAQAIVHEGMKHMNNGLGVMGIRSGIEQATKDVVAALQKLSKPIKTKEEIRQIAIISAESEELGKIIAETIEKVGKDGVVTVEESQVFGLESEIVEGLQFDKGYISPYMITNSDRMEAEYKDASVLITDKKISAFKDIFPILEKLAQTGKKELVIICEDMDGEALSTCVINRLRGGFNILAIKAPAYGERKKELLADIAVVTGATVISEETGMSLETADLTHLGHTARILTTKDVTTIIGGKGSKKDITARISQIKAQRELCKAKYEIEKFDERIAKLTGGVAIIKVGAATETEMKYLKLKIEDAVNATKAAIDEGIVVGGGAALIHACRMAEENNKKSKANRLDEFVVGYSIVVKACEMPLRQIAINCGKGDGTIVVRDVQEVKGNSGYDALKDCMPLDMFEAGIIDPVKVTRMALQNAASAAAILLTTEVIVTQVEQPKN